VSTVSQPPTGYAVRPAASGDLSDVAALLAACDTHDLGFVEFTESQIRSQWANPELDLSTDSWLVTTHGGAAVAVAVLFVRQEHANLASWGSVHPDHRDRGLGAFLLDAVDARASVHRDLAPQDREVRVEIDILAVDRAAEQLLHARGYRAARRFWRMDRDLVPGTRAPEIGRAHV